MNIFDAKKMTDYFPFPAFRQYQKETIEKIESHISSGVKNIILEMPTGSGKSAIAVSAGLWSHNSYVLTSQKILQDQYVRDFTESFDVAVMKGRGNYECTFLGSPANCDECYEPARKTCYLSGSCLYKNAKDRAIGAQVALMNYAYFLNVVDCDPRKAFKPRKLLICDEAHGCENVLMGQVEFLLSEYNFKKLGYVVSVPTLDTVQQYEQWIKLHIQNLSDLLKTKNKELEDLNRERVNLDKTSRAFINISKEATELSENTQELDRLYRRLNVFLTTLTTVEWVFSVEKTEKKQFKKVVFRPLTVDKFANEALLQYGEHRLFLSATILDKKSFCKSLGVDAHQAEFIQVQSTFPPENRKIYFTNTGYMNLKKIEETLPNIVKDVEKALEYHKSERGIIHCVEENSIIMCQNKNITVKNIVSGDKVKTFNEKTKEFEFKKVKKVFDNGHQQCLRLKFATTEIICTADHLILTTNRGWVKAIDLNENDDVICNK